MLRSCCRSAILPAAASLDRGTVQRQKSDGAGDGGDPDDGPGRQDAQQQEQHHDDDAHRRTSCTEVLSTGSHSAAASRPTTAAPIPATAAWISARSRAADQSGSAAPRSRNDGRKIATSAIAGARDAVRRRILDRTEVGREREQRPGHGLGGAVAGEECLLGHPARDDHGLVEERQDDVAAAEDERTRAVEARRTGAGCATRRARRRARAGTKNRSDEELRAHDRRSPADREPQRQRQRLRRGRGTAYAPTTPATRIVASCPSVPG